MSKQTNIKPATKSTDRYDAFSVREYQVKGETKHDWSRIGAAFPNADGKGFRIQLHALPVDGVVVLRLYEAKPDGE